MSEFNIEVAGGSSVRLPTAGKYCDRDIVVKATGGGGGSSEPLLDVLLVNGNGVYTLPDGYSGVKKIIVNSDTATDTTTVYWDGNTDGLYTHDGYSYKISDFIPDFSRYSKDVTIRVRYAEGSVSGHDATVRDYGDHWYGEAGDFAGFDIYPSDHDSGGGIFTSDQQGSFYIESITFTKLAGSGGESGGESGGNGTYSYTFSEYDHTYEFDGHMWVKVSDETPHIDTFSGSQTVEVRNGMMGGETETDDGCNTYDRDYGYCIYSFYYSYDLVAVVTNESYAASSGIGTGVYFRYDMDYLSTISVTPN